MTPEQEKAERAAFEDFYRPRILARAWDGWLARAEIAHAEIAQYLKDDETPAQCLERNRKDVGSMLEMLATERRKVERLTTALSHLNFAARSSGGVAGRDQFLCNACDQAEDILVAHADALTASAAPVLSLHGMEPAEYVDHPERIPAPVSSEPMAVVTDCTTYEAGVNVWKYGVGTFRCERKLEVGTWLYTSPTPPADHSALIAEAKKKAEHLELWAGGVEREIANLVRRLVAAIVE